MPSISSSFINLKIGGVTNYVKNTHQDTVNKVFLTLIIDATSGILSTLAILDAVKVIDIGGVQNCIALLTFALIADFIASVATLPIWEGTGMDAANEATSAIGLMIGIPAFIYGIASIAFAGTVGNLGDLILALTGIGLAGYSIYLAL